MSFQAKRERVTRLALQRELELKSIEMNLRTNLAERDRLRLEKEDLIKLSDITARLVVSSYGDSLKSLEKLLNYGVSIAYSRSIQIVVIEDVKSSRPTLKIGVVDGGSEPVSPDRAHGGGLAQILGFLVRVLMILAQGKRRLLILDEPFSAVSDDLLEDLSQLLREVVDKLGFQIVMVTHQRELGQLADVAYELDGPGSMKRIV